MAVYAAMIDRMDQGIGRVMEKVKQLGKEENTLVIFLSDNGGCGQQINRTPDVPPGPVNSYHAVDAPWANVSNTPFRLFKVFDHEGGISSPMIVRWPRIITRCGAITHDVGHVMDFMPTVAELAETEYPTTFEGRNVLPMEGRSLVPALKGESLGTRGPLFWEHQGCRAVRDGKWKLVTQGPEREHVGMRIGPGHQAWELYDIEADRCELRDLSREFPPKVAERASLWQAWYDRCARQNV